MTRKVLAPIAIIAVILVVVIGGYLALTGKNFLPVPEPIIQRPAPVEPASVQPTAPVVDTTKDKSEMFDKNPVIKSVSFTTSTGEQKKIIIVETETEIDTYITDSNLSKKSALKLSFLSGENIALRYSGGRNILVSISPGPGKKFIVVSYQMGDAYPTSLFDENGILIAGEDIVGNAYELVKDKCQCGFGFDSWKDKDKFYVEVRTAGGGNYRILIDANTGKTIGAPQVKN